jgi:hypothetical protein
VTRLSIAVLCSSLLFAPCSGLLLAGDAVVVGYNADGIWTDVTYYRSATPKGGKDYRTSNQARESAIRDVRKRSKFPVATTKIVSFSDLTGFVAVAHGQNKSGRDFHAVGRGKSQPEADQQALQFLNEAGAGEEQTIVYRYFSYGVVSK